MSRPGPLLEFDASAVRGFLNVEQSDLFITPDPSTLSIFTLAALPTAGWCGCSAMWNLILVSRPFEWKFPAYFKRAVKEAAQMGYGL